MPALINGADGTVKRKRVASKQNPIKRARSESSEADAQASIILLESEVFESKKHYNNISKLIGLFKIKVSDSEDSTLASIALCRIFTRLMAAGELTREQGTSEKDAVVIQWLRERYFEYKNALIELFADEDVSSTALTMCMRMLKSEGTHLKAADYNFPTNFLTDIVQALLKPGTDANVRSEFSEKFVEENDDLRYYTFSVLE